MRLFGIKKCGPRNNERAAAFAAHNAKIKKAYREKVKRRELRQEAYQIALEAQERT